MEKMVNKTLVLVVIVSLFLVFGGCKSKEGSSSEKGSSNASFNTAEKNYTTTPPKSYTPQEVEPQENQSLFVIIKDYDPWGVPQNENVLNSKNLSYDVITTDMLFTWDFEAKGNKIAIIASDQAQGSYDNLVLNKEKLATFVNNGGILLAHSADYGWHSGHWTESFLPDGVTHISFDEFPFARWWEVINLLQILDPAHPVVEGITDESLDWWWFSTHGYFTNLPLDANVIIALEEDSGEPTYPVYIQYNYGNGRVLATLQPIEGTLWRPPPALPPEVLLSNEIDYALCLYDITPPEITIMSPEETRDYSWDETFFVAFKAFDPETDIVSITARIDCNPVNFGDTNLCKGFRLWQSLYAS